MRRVATLLSMFLLSILLAGCITIPLTDGGTIEISSDGITINKDDDDGNNDNEDSTNDKKEDTTSDEKEDEKESKDSTNENNGGDAESDDQGNDFSEGFGGCNNEFYLLQNRLPEYLPLTPCPTFTFIEIATTEERTDTIAHFETHGTWSEEYDNYHNYLSDEGFQIEENKNSDDGSFIGKKDGIEVQLYTRQLDSDTVEVQLMFMEEPGRVYPVTDSIINYDEKTATHGTCQDEYYILLELLPDDLPINSCVTTSYLSIEFDLEYETNHLTVIFNTTGSRATEIEKYKEFLLEKGYLLDEDSGANDDGTLYFDSLFSTMFLNAEDIGTGIVEVNMKHSQFSVNQQK